MAKQRESETNEPRPTYKKGRQTVTVEGRQEFEEIKSMK
jgi:hypothetical protein